MKESLQHQERSSRIIETQAPQQQNRTSFVDNRDTAQMRLMDAIQRTGVEKEPLQGKFETIQQKANNTGLPDNLKSGVENMSGFSMDDVRVHYNSSKPLQLQAHAYTQGTDIHVAPGQEKYLPHEAWHVVQQMQGRVQPTMQMQGVNVNDNEGLEREADVMGGRAIQKRTTKLQSSDLKTFHGNSNMITQMYMIEKHGGVLYNVSYSKNIICGISYPNHELYVKKKDQIDTANARIKSGLVELISGDIKKFGGTNYTSVIPLYKKDISRNNEFTTGAFFKDLRKEGPLPFPVQDEVNSDLTIINIITDTETIRKILIQWLMMFGSINTKIQNINEFYSEVYKGINLYLDGKLTFDNCLKIIISFILFLEEMPITPFDDDGLVIEIRSIAERLKNNVLLLNTSVLPTRKRQFAALRDEEMRNHKGESTFPAGCDLMARTLLQEGNKGSLYYHANRNSDDFHYSTIILDEGLDFVVMEGFARGRQGFDHNWEFIMHGNLISGVDHEDCFKRYNDVLFGTYLDINVSDSFSYGRASTRNNIVANVSGLHKTDK